MTDLKNYLTSVADFHREHGVGPTLDAFVLEHGREMTFVPGLPDGVERGEMKNCYENALLAAAQHEGDDGVTTLFYCEGYATGRAGIPVLHAWLCDVDGNVYDPTWEHGSEYFGIAFNPEWAVEQTIALDYYGLLCNDWMAEESLVVNGLPDEALAELESPLTGMDYRP